VASAIDNANLYRQALRATRTRDEVLAIVSHDLRNPLHAITLGAGQLLKQVGDDPSRHFEKRLIEGVVRAATRTKTLIQDLLDVSCVEAGELVVSPESCPVAELIQEAMAENLPMAAERSQSLTWTVAPGIAAVQADRKRILQVLGNLLSNAVKFTPAGGRIALRVTRHGDRVWFAVSDTGPGIPVADQAHIFDRFWQARHARRAGAGLGLSIARGIVAAHGGRLWVESTPGEGSTFLFDLQPTDSDGAIGMAAA
jgi:signal transduction histidine kinase